MALSLEQYLDIHPMAAWNRQSWNEYDAMIDTAFHEPDIHFTPLANYIDYPKGVGLNQRYFTGRQLVQSNANHNPIGWYQRYTDSIYVDTREKQLYSRKRYGGKAQYDEYDELVTRFSGDTPGFIKAVMNEQLLNNVKWVHEKIARDAILMNSKFKFMGNKSLFDTTHDVSDFDLSGSNMFDITYLDEVARRFSIRSMDARRNYGDFANPVPGEDFRNSVLVMVPSMVYADIWDSPAKEYLIQLRQYGDERPINSANPAFQYRNITIADYGSELTLFNAGNIMQQNAVIEPINWGDGAPDPETAGVDGIWLTGQGNTNVKHYVQCTPASFQAGDFEYGEMVNLHVRKASASGALNLGVDAAPDMTDGMTITMEVYSSDPSAGTIVFRKPVTEQYNADLGGGVYAWVTKAQHVHPVYVVGARGMVTWAARTKIEWNSPSDEQADFPSVKRVTWNERGEMNPWDLDCFEVVFCEAKFANRGNVEIR
jgi:hypothetical protein